MHILVTGCAGFIGWRVSKKLLEEGHQVVGIDNLNDYYDVRLKEYRLEDLKAHKNFTFYQGDIENLEFLEGVFKKYSFDAVINEAARAGVRASLQNPFVYFTTNALGTLNLLELCKNYGVSKFVLASTSSLYAGQPMPFKEDLPVNTPSPFPSASRKYPARRKRAPPGVSTPRGSRREAPTPRLHTSLATRPSPRPTPKTGGSPGLQSRLPPRVATTGSRRKARDTPPSSPHGYRAPR